MKIRNLSMVLLPILVLSCDMQDRVERLNHQLLEADRAFSLLSMHQGANRAFETYAASEAVLLRPDHMPLEGKEALMEVYRDRDDSTFELTWEPLHARVARSGELGYTYGVYTLRMKGTGQESTGTYASVWVHEEGSWKWILDTGNQGTGVTDGEGELDSGQ
jgi:ketosteroid isomerase-like protein